MDKRSPEDPKGLIFEAYRIEGISLQECRTIFLDWALSLPDDQSQTVALQTLVARYGDRPNHPMTEVLEEGMASIATPRRRGGGRGRRG